jgi:hypothetical protein
MAPQSARWTSPTTSTGFHRPGQEEPKLAVIERPSVNVGYLASTPKSRG